MIVIIMLFFLPMTIHAEENLNLEDLQNQIVKWVKQCPKILGLDVEEISGENGTVAFSWKANVISLSRAYEKGATLEFSLAGEGITPVRKSTQVIENVSFWDFKVYYGNCVGVYNYYFGLKPLRFEISHDKHKKNILGQIYLGFDIPYTELIGKYWNKIMKPKPRFRRPLSSQPVKVYISYSRKYSENKEKQDKDRLDLDVAYRMHFLDQFILRLRSRHFYFIRNKNKFWYLDFSIGYPVGKKSEIIIKWSKGELPPTWQKVDNINLGYSFRF